jgi:hypothetical protein
LQGKVNEVHGTRDGLIAVGATGPLHGHFSQGCKDFQSRHGRSAERTALLPGHTRLTRN